MNGFTISLIVTVLLLTQSKVATPFTTARIMAWKSHFYRILGIPKCTPFITNTGARNCRTCSSLPFSTYFSSNHSPRTPRSISALHSIPKYTYSPKRKNTLDELYEGGIDRVYNELERVSRALLYHDDLYYNSQPTISDAEYDALARAEAEICANYPELRSRWELESGLGASATRMGRVGAPVPARRQISHLSPMMSLNNGLSDENITSWVTRLEKGLRTAGSGDIGPDSIGFAGPDTVNHHDPLEILAEPKLDGLSLSLRFVRQGYQRYKFVGAATRGDGKVGEDVTRAVANMNIPRRLSGFDFRNETIEIRGEVVLPLDVFDALANDPAGANFSNARNAASGILLRTASERTHETESLRSSLLFYAYDIVPYSPAFTRGTEIRRALSSLGFYTPEPSLVTTAPQSLCDFHNRLLSLRPSLDYDIDGAVYKLNSLRGREILGSSRRAPRWALAHKYPAESVVTTLKDVEINIGRTGALTPVGILDPVRMTGGVTVSRVTLHNFAFVKKMLGERVTRGARLMIERSGDVIPRVVERVSDGDGEELIFDFANPPTSCPSCGSPVEYDDSGEEETILRCTGSWYKCKVQAIGGLSHAFSKDGLDVRGLSKGKLEQLYEADLIRRPSDLFDIIETNGTLRDRIAELPNWGNRSADNLFSSAQKVVEEGVSLHQYINSLGIRHVGEYSSQILANCFHSAEVFLEALEKQQFDVLKEQMGIGPVIVASLFDFSSDEEAVDAAKALAKAVPINSLVVTNSTANTDQNLLYGTGEVAKNDKPLFFARDEYSLDEEYAYTNDELVSRNSYVQKPLLGWSIAFTGTIPNVTRRDAQRMALRNGARKCPKTLNKSTDVLVVGSGQTKSKKTKDAEQWGVKIMHWKDFLNACSP